MDIKITGIITIIMNHNGRMVTHMVEEITRSTISTTIIIIIIMATIKNGMIMIDHHKVFYSLNKNLFIRKKYLK